MARSKHSLNFEISQPPLHKENGLNILANVECDHYVKFCRSDAGSLELVVVTDCPRVSQVGQALDVLCPFAFSMQFLFCLQMRCSVGICPFGFAMPTMQSRLIGK